MNTTITVKIPRNSFAPASIVSRLHTLCNDDGIEYRTETLHVHRTTFAPLEVSGEADDRTELSALLDTLRRWAADLNKTVSVRFTMRVGGTLIETTEPVAGRGQTLGLMADIAESLDILDEAGVASSVNRILLDPRERIEATADVGIRTAYIVDLTNRTVRIAGGAGNVPEPVAQ